MEFSAAPWFMTVTLSIGSSARSPFHLILESFLTARPMMTFCMLMMNGHANVMIHSITTRWQHVYGPIVLWSDHGL